MMKCPKDKVDSAAHRATIMVCPKCGRILNADDLLRLVKRLGLSKEVVEQVKKEIRTLRVIHEL